MFSFYHLSFPLPFNDIFQVLLITFAWIFPTTSGLVSQQKWLVLPAQLFNPCQSHRGKIPPTLCSSAHSPSMAPLVCRVKSHYLRLAFEYFQNLTPTPFPIWRPNVFILSRVPASCFPSMLYPFLSPWLSPTCASYCVKLKPHVFYRTHSGLIAFHWIFLTHLLGLLCNVLLCT